MAESGDWSTARGQTEPPWLDVFLANRDELAAFLRRKAGPRHQPQDLLHELFIRMSCLRETSGIDNPKAYLFRAAANLVIDTVRADRHRHEKMATAATDYLTVHDPAPDALQATIDRDRLRRLDRALAKLPEETRAMIYLLRIDGLSYDAVARLFGVSKSTVEKRVAKALRFCREVLEHGDTAEP